MTASREEARVAGSPSMKDVAAHARVSLGTVSNVLNRPDSVSDHTRQRVLAVIERLGYVRSESARQLRADFLFVFGVAFVLHGAFCSI